MKNIIYAAILCGFASISFAQVAVGKNAVNGNNTILDFEESTTNGIILPAITTVPTGLDATNNGGTFAFDLTDSKVKMYENGIWVELSDVREKTALLTNSSNEIGEGVIIGAETSAATGILVLESDEDAMILPKVEKP
ncbi:hypothetical protein [Empedobacter falsenii]|uniref:hypothetical protein n=1 Tax=Empedobacter falsenii TaxID=343874 RepID=UPI002577688F|nr:hypothetical protein [Empedobacter falsenii]